VMLILVVPCVFSRAVFCLGPKNDLHKVPAEEKYFLLYRSRFVERLCVGRALRFALRYFVLMWSACSHKYSFESRCFDLPAAELTGRLVLTPGLRVLHRATSYEVCMRVGWWLFAFLK
jgi:hypothetical protein